MLTNTPKFGPGNLPVEYLPLSMQTLRPKEYFGPLSFTVNASSHNHHLNYLRQSGATSQNHIHQHLYPFEIWSLIRVLSQWKYGRLNELISIRAERRIVSIPKPGQALVGEAKVLSVKKQGGLCFCFLQSTTRTEAGKECMSAVDVLLLISECDRETLLYTIAQGAAERVETFVESPTSVLARWDLRMRFQWPNELWRNNIHTDEYARSLGYERALVEGPTLADLVWHADQTNSAFSTPAYLSWKYLSPLYVDTPVVLVRSTPTNAALRQYQICEEPKRFPSRSRVLLEMEVLNL